MSQDTLARFADCIAACHACAVACHHCAASCLQEPHVHEMTRCIGLDLDCAQVCQVTAALMAGGGDRVAALCRVCADICNDCAQECARHDMDHCQQCAEACRLCATQCETMASQG